MVKDTCRCEPRRFWAGTRFVAVAMACVVLINGHTSSARAAGLAPLAAVPESVSLEVDRRFERTISADAVYRFTISLSVGEYVRVVVDDANATTDRTLSDPSGKKVFSAWEPSTGPNGHAEFEYVAESGGVYALSVTLAPKGRTIPFAVVLDEARPATEVDRARAVAYRAMSDGVAGIRELPQTNEARRIGIERLVEARRMWHALGDVRRESGTIDELATGYAMSGRVREAAELLAEAVAAARSRGDVDALLPMLVHLANDHLQLGDAAAVTAELDEAFEVGQTRHDEEWEFRAYEARGACLHSQGNLRAARECLERANEIGERIGHGPHPLAGAIGGLAIDDGRLADALAIFETIVSEAQARNDLLAACGAQTAISNVLDMLGDYQGAITMAKQALPVAMSTPGDFGVCYLQAHLGYLYLELGELDESARYFEESLRRARAAGYLAHVANAQMGLGQIYLTRGEARDALAAYQDAARAIDAAGFSEGKAIALSGEGAAYEALGDTSRADVAFDRALDVADAHDRAIDQEEVRLVSGAALTARDAARAERMLDRALEIGRSLRDRRGVAVALFELARIDRAAGRLGRSSERVREAVAVAESLRHGIKSPELRTSYFATVRSYYDLYTDVLMREGGAASVAEAFTVAERGRGRVLLETLSERGVDLTAGVPSSLRVEEQSARGQLIGRLDYQVRLLGREHTPEEEAQTAREVTALEDRLADVEGRMRSASPAYAALTSPEPVTAEALQRELLDSGTALVAYSLGEDAGYVWSVTTDGVTSARIPGRRAIEAHVQALRRAVAARACAPNNEASDERTARLKAADAAYTVEARRLGDEILAPVAGALKGKRLAIVPDGALALVPFGALVEPGTDKYVIEGHEVVTLPSASALRTLREQEAKRTTPAGAVAIVADPVFDAGDARVTNAKTSDAPKLADSALALRAAGGVGNDACGERAGLERLRGSAREADAIAALAPRNQRLEAVGFAANLDLATSGELGKYRIVHFATHGYVPAETPELSGLVLSLVDERGRERPGYLGMPQIYAMRLPVETVVLSACETGLGREVSGEGVIGLVRGFMYAGSSRVVSSLWKIDDAETAGLMAELYAGMLKRGRTPSAALREAQLKLIEDGQSPYVWGAFQLAGEWR